MQLDYGFKITADYISAEDEDDTYKQDGRQRGRDQRADEAAVIFYLADDDGELYYKGLGWGDDFEIVAFDWGMAYAGSSMLLDHRMEQVI